MLQACPGREGVRASLDVVEGVCRGSQRRFHDETMREPNGTLVSFKKAVLVRFCSPNEAEI